MARMKIPSVQEIKARVRAHFDRLPIPKTLELAQLNEEFLDAIPEGNELPRLPASSISLQDLKEIFDLWPVNRQFFDVPDEGLLQMPSELDKEIEEELEMLERDPKNEAECRLIVNKIFLHCLKVERRSLAFAPNPPKHLPSFTLETHLELEVCHKGIRKLLTGDMDYTMNYAADETAAGLVVLEAKAPTTMGVGFPQCLAYMAMIHTIRKQRAYENSVVCGVVSNGRDYQFLRIDNDTKYCSWRPCTDWNDRTKHEIYTVMRLMIRNAAMSSPRVSTQGVKIISPSHPITTQSAQYHLRVGSADDDGEEMEFS
ncbi:hypothetical protein BDW59DRAFT_162478 [Aspergillus cavernicola]|uniref:Uncharacterized protein n=1 Tax=Aspergillus cavernicola TaxID=176166 RepID=A0ABR4I9H0_9EURO